MRFANPESTPKGLLVLLALLSTALGLYLVGAGLRGLQNSARVVIGDLARHRAWGPAEALCFGPLFLAVAALLLWLGLRKNN